jgi:hypothetical protein
MGNCSLEKKPLENKHLENHENGSKIDHTIESFEYYINAYNLPDPETVPNLKTLRVTITTDINIIPNYKNLTNLYISSSNYLKKVHLTIKCNKSLESLIFKHCETNINTCFPKVHELVFNNCTKPDLNSSHLFPNLKTLHLYDCNNVIIPDYHNLEKLVVYNTTISVGKLLNLKTLLFQETDNIDLNSFIMPKLETLNISHCDNIVLPKSLYNLNILNISTSLIFYEELFYKNLTDLTIHHCTLESLRNMPYSMAKSLQNRSYTDSLRKMHYPMTEEVPNVRSFFLRYNLGKRETYDFINKIPLYRKSSEPEHIKRSVILNLLYRRHTRESWLLREII